MNKIFEEFRYMDESRKIKIANDQSDYSYPYLCRGNGIFGSKYLFGIDIYNKYYSHIGDIRINTGGKIFDTYNADDKLAIFDSSDNLIDCDHYKMIYDKYIK